LKFLFKGDGKLLEKPKLVVGGVLNNELVRECLKGVDKCLNSANVIQ
jgi:hypothetical protein